MDFKRPEPVIMEKQIPNLNKNISNNKLHIKSNPG